jgi:ATP-dependent DNA helicase RecG
MIKDFEVILSEGEGHTVEFKEQPDKSLATEVCAFANASGGRIFIGVDDNGAVVGTDVGNSARSRIQDTINKIEPRLSVNISVHDTVMVISVPEGDNKPYSCAQGFYLRSGPNSQKLTRNSIIDFLQSEGRTRYDSIANSEFPVSQNFNQAEFNRYLQKSGISKVLPVESILVNLGCAKNIGGKFIYTNAGALFFRNNKEDIFFEHAHVICALYKGTDKAIIIDVKEFSGGMLENIDNAMTFLKRNLRLRYAIRDVQREEIYELPLDALREAVVNAVCHRDYFEIGARVMIEIFDDRVEITNPGGVPKGITADNFGTISVARNPTIASLLHRVQYIERMGTGIQRITLAAENAGIAKPLFELHKFFKVTFIKPQPGKNPGRPVDGIAKTGKADKKPIKKADKKSIHVEAVVAYIKDHGAISNAEARNILGLAESTTKRFLGELVQNGVLEVSGEKKGRRYTIAKT